ncbi:hypothetical protein CUMW_108880 [Citrus unshiu]|nr:hypothetical protein CUMW_108880 [Citrus unshiu]
MKKKITEKIDKVVMSRMAVSPGRLYGDSGGGILGLFFSLFLVDFSGRAAAYGSSVLYSSGEFGNFKEPIIGVEVGIIELLRVEVVLWSSALIRLTSSISKYMTLDHVQRFSERKHMVTACTKFEVSPDTYPVVSRFLNEEETKAWGLEPYDTEVAENLCIKAFFSDAMDYLSPRYLNKALQIWRGSSSDGLVTFTVDLPVFTCVSEICAYQNTIIGHSFQPES